MQIPNILIVDDEEEMRNTLKSFLSARLDCSIFEVADGKSALDELTKNTFDLVLLDIKMPGISGVDVIKQIKTQEVKPDVLMISKYDSSDIAKEVIEEGVVDYLPKPFSLKALEIRVKELLSKKDKYIPRKT